MKRLTAKGIRRYLENNYGECRHNEYSMFNAIKIVAKEESIKQLDLFKYIVEREDIPGRWVTSYGFDTAYGRDIRDRFRVEYFNSEVENG